jgi:hypothetical protein
METTPDGLRTAAACRSLTPNSHLCRHRDQTGRHPTTHLLVASQQARIHGRAPPASYLCIVDARKRGRAPHEVFVHTALRTYCPWPDHAEKVLEGSFNVTVSHTAYKRRRIKQTRLHSTYATHDVTAQYTKPISTQNPNSGGFNGFSTVTSACRASLLAFGVHSTRPSLSSPVATYSFWFARTLRSRPPRSSSWTLRRSYLQRRRPHRRTDQTITSADTGF